MSNMINKSAQEMLFWEHSAQCLTIIEKAAMEIAIQGVAVVAFVPGVNPEDWISRMKVVGLLTDNDKNFLSIAYSKAGEMADTLKDSGTTIRTPKFGEFGFQGGVIERVNTGYLIAVFSGGTGEEDVNVARKGLEWLCQFFN